MRNVDEPPEAKGTAAPWQSGSALRAGAALAGNAGLTLAGSVVGAGFSLGNEVIVAHFLGVETYGAYGLALMMAKVGEIVALFGLPLSVLHFLPVHLSLSENRLAVGVFLGWIALPLALGVGFALEAGLQHDWLAARVFNLPQSAPYIAVLALAIPMTVLAEVFGSIARGFGRFLPSVVIRNLLPPLCYMAALVALAVSGGPKIGTAYAYTAAAAASAAVGLVWVSSLIGGRIGIARPQLRLRELYAFASPLALNSMVAIVFLWVDMFVMAAYTDGKTVGIYRGCTQILLTFDLVLTACSVATAPIYAVAASHRPRLQETLTAATRIGTVLATPLALALLFNSGDILRLLGGGFAAGGMALATLAVGQLTKVIFGAAGTAMIICGRPGIEVQNTSAAACLNLALNLILVPRLGLYGAAVSTAISLIALSAVRAWRLWTVLGLRVADGMLARILLVSTPLATLVWLVSLAVGAGPGAGFPALVLRLAAMGILVCGGLWFFCLKRVDRAALVGIVMRKPPAGPDALAGAMEQPSK